VRRRKPTVAENWQFFRVDGNAMMELPAGESIEGISEVHLQPPRLKIKVNDSGEEVELELPLGARVADVKDEFQTRKRRRLGALSLRGEPLSDEMPLPNASYTLYGVIPVSVVDRKCDLDKTIDAFDFWTVEQLRQAFAERTGRLLSERATLTIEGREGPLDLREKLFNYKIGANHTVHVANPPFRVRIKSKQITGRVMPETELEISDEFTIGQVKMAYAAATQDVMGAGDRFIFNNEELDDSVPVFRCRLRENDLLLLERQEVLQAFVYQCADCGADQRIKRKDPVRCKFCNWAIFFKKRNVFKPMQYVAR
jgi:DNA-directed RNA polymerase subunit RPC12/RpoP